MTMTKRYVETEQNADEDFLVELFLRERHDIDCALGHACPIPDACPTSSPRDKTLVRDAVRAGIRVGQRHGARTEFKACLDLVTGIDLDRSPKLSHEDIVEALQTRAKEMGYGG